MGARSRSLMDIGALLVFSFINILLSQIGQDLEVVTTTSWCPPGSARIVSYLFTYHNSSEVSRSGLNQAELIEVMGKHDFGSVSQPRCVRRSLWQWGFILT